MCREPDDRTQPATPTGITHSNQQRPSRGSKLPADSACFGSGSSRVRAAAQIVSFCVRSLSCEESENPGVPATPGMPAFSRRRLRCCSRPPSGAGTSRRIWYGRRSRRRSGRAPAAGGGREGAGFQPAAGRGPGWAVAGQGRRAVRHSAWVREDVVPGDRVRRDRRRAEGPHARCAIWLVCSMPGPPSGYPRATSIRAASRWTWCRAAGGSRGLPHGQVSGRRHGRESAVIVGEPTVGRLQPAEKLIMPGRTPVCGRPEQ